MVSLLHVVEQALALLLEFEHRGVPDDEAEGRVAELAEAVDVANRLRHHPYELSGGQRQRVAIARALANDPPVILADEPTGNLDTATSIQIMKLLLDLNGQGRTILMVSHEEDIAAYAKSRIVLRDGKICAREGTVLE